MTDQMSFTEYRKTLLASIYKAIEEDVSKFCNVSKLVSALGLHGRTGWMREALIQYEQEGVLQTQIPLRGDAQARITGYGIQTAEDLVDDGWDSFDPASLGFKPPSLREPRSASPQSPVPDVDRVVSLDHSSATYREAIAALDAVMDRLRGDNELACQFPEEHGQRVAELEAGRRLLDAPQASVGAVERTLVAGLKWFAEQLAGAAVAPLIAAALGTVAAAFGAKWFIGG